MSLMRTPEVLLLAAALLLPFSGARAQAAPEAPGQTAGAADAAPQASAGALRVEGALRLEVRLGDRQLLVYDDDQVVKTYPVAVGLPKHPTPQGEFDIRRMIWNPRWVPPEAKWARGKKAKAPGEPGNPMGRVKMFFLPPDYYIHGTNQEESLGQAESHGCVRMANEDIVELAQLVMEHGGEPREPGWFQRILNRVRSTHEVRLSTPVPVSIRQ